MSARNFAANAFSAGPLHVWSVVPPTLKVAKHSGSFVCGVRRPRRPCGVAKALASGIVGQASGRSNEHMAGNTCVAGKGR